MMRNGKQSWEGERGRNAEKSHGVLRRAVLCLIVAVLIASCIWFWWLFLQIRQTSLIDQAAPADAIAVFGAAEYYGRPSPVLNARLQHALDLYRQGLAPLIICLGGGVNTQYSEGAVGQAFFLSHGVPESRIIAETTSRDTEESVARLAAIARENGLRKILAVSDGTHMFRIRQLSQAQGLHVLLSPRPPGRSVSELEMAERYAHEMAGYTLWRLHVY